MYNCYIYLVYNNVQLRAHFIADVVKFTALVLRGTQAACGAMKRPRPHYWLC